MQAKLLIYFALCAGPQSWFLPSPQEVSTEIIKEVTVETKPLVSLYDSSKLSLETITESKLIGLSPSWCSACRLSTSPVNRLLDIDWQAIEMEGCPQYPAVYDPETKHFYFGTALNSLETLDASIDSIKKQKGFNTTKSILPAIGSVDKDQLKFILELLGTSGSFQRGAKPLSKSYNSFNITFPADLKLSWSTANEETKFVLNKPVPVKLFLFEQKVTGLTITPTKVTLNLRMCPDLSLEVK